MRIIEIKKLSLGGHRNQTGNFKTIPEGYAVIPEDMETPNFPFGDVTAEEIDGVMTVTNWVAGEIPEVEEPEQIPSETEQLKAEIARLETQLTDTQLALCEVYEMMI